MFLDSILKKKTYFRENESKKPSTFQTMNNEIQSNSYRIPSRCQPVCAWYTHVLEVMFVTVK